MKKNEGVILGVVFVLLGVLIVIHHLVICGRLFDVADILHHEFFEAIFFTAGIAILVITIFDRKRYLVEA